MFYSYRPPGLVISVVQKVLQKEGTVLKRVSLALDYRLCEMLLTFDLPILHSAPNSLGKASVGGPFGGACRCRICNDYWLTSYTSGDCG